MMRGGAALFALALGACASGPPDQHAFASPQFIAAEATPTPNQMPAVQAYRLPVTARCWDGWYSYSDQRGGTCAGHRGVRAWLNKPDR